MELMSQLTSSFLEQITRGEGMDVRDIEDILHIDERGEEMVTEQINNGDGGGGGIGRGNRNLKCFSNFGNETARTVKCFSNFGNETASEK